MAITKIPGVYYSEDTEVDVQGEGAKIPVFIGVTNNTASTGYAVDGSQILTFRSWDEVNRAVADGGIGVWSASTTNLLLNAIKEFYEEVEITSNDDLGIPKIYVIDVGAGATHTVWNTAFSTAKSVHDVELEAYIGAEKVADSHEVDGQTVQYTIKDIIAAASASILTETANRDLRVGVYTDYTKTTDATMITLANTIQEKRILGFIEPSKVGKHIGLICTTPYYVEPGYRVFRSIAPGEFKNRTPAEEIALQNAGIIFGHDERTTKEVYPKMNLCVMSEFSKATRPADSLAHTRFIADHVLRLIFDVCYNQIKQNETETNIVYLQTQVDKVIDDEIEKGYLIKYDEATGKGSKLIVQESDYNPYDVLLGGKLQCTNSTLAIQVSTVISNPVMRVI